MAVPSVSRQRGGDRRPGATTALRACPWLEVERVGDNVVARTDAGPRPAPGAGRAPRHGAAGRQRGAEARGRHAVGRRRVGHEGRPRRHARPGHAPCSEPAVDVTWCFYAREEIGRDDSGLLELWQARPELLAGDAAVLGRADQRAGRGRLPGHDAGAHHAARRAGPHGPPLHGPQRHPSPGPAAAAGGATGQGARSCWTGAPTPSSSRWWRSRAEWRPTSCPTRRQVTLNHRYAPDRGQGRGGGVPPRAPRPDARAGGGRHLGAARRRRRCAAVPRASAAEGAGRAERRRAQGEGRVDRRGVVLGARRAGRQLRARATRCWRIIPTSGCRRAQLERARDVLLALIA